MMRQFGSIAFGTIKSSNAVVRVTAKQINNANRFKLGRAARYMSTTPDNGVPGETSGVASSGSTSPASTLSDIAHPMATGTGDAATHAATNLSTDGIVSSASVAADLVAAVPQPNFIVSGVMDIVDNVHLFMDIPYWEAIIVSTIGLRVLLFPIALKSIQSSGRMAAMRPAMEKVQANFKNDPNNSDIKAKAKYEQEMRALFVKYKVNPFRAMMFPFVQLPVFISIFMALKQMGEHFPGFATGGALWFQDLGMADPTYILPVFNSLSFLIMIEIGSDGVQMQQKGHFKWIMRGLAVAMVPLTASMPQGLFVYWAANNTLSIIQTNLLKWEPLRQYFDIPKPPAPEDTPNLKVQNPFSAVMKVSVCN